MSTYFLRKAYERGLKGEKPHIVLGEHLFDAQMQGYRRYRFKLAATNPDSGHEGEECGEQEVHTCKGREPLAVKTRLNSGEQRRGILFVVLVALVLLVWVAFGFSR